MNLPRSISAKDHLMNARLKASATKATAGGGAFLSPDKGAGSQLIGLNLSQPGEISNFIAQRAEGSLAVRVFGNGLTVNTGSAFFSELKPENLDATGVKERTEGSEYAMVQVTPPDLKRLKTSDIGGKFRVSDEAQEEGVLDVLRDGIALVSNSIANTLDEMAVTALRKSVEATGASQPASIPWRDVQLTGATPTPPQDTPAAAIILAQAQLARNGLRAEGNLLVLNPTEEAFLKIAYGDGYAALLEGLKIEVATSPLIALNEAYLVDTRGLGGLASKKGLVTETWRDHSIRSTWVQTYLEPAIYVSRPSNIISIDNTFNEGE